MAENHEIRDDEKAISLEEARDLSLEEACARLKNAVRDAALFEHLPGGEVACETVAAAAEALLRGRWAASREKTSGYSGLEDLELHAAEARARADAVTEAEREELEGELARVGNAAYNATRIVEVLECVGTFLGNGHHARQHMAEIAKDALRELRWNLKQRGE